MSSFSPPNKSADAAIEITEMTRQSTPSPGEAAAPTPSTSSIESGDKALEALGYTPVSLVSEGLALLKICGLLLTYHRYSNASFQGGPASVLL